MIVSPFRSLVLSELSLLLEGIHHCHCVSELHVYYHVQSTQRASRREYSATTINMTMHDTVTGSPDSSVQEPVNEKEGPVGAHIEAIHTNEKVPGNPGYYEKDGLRTYGDDEDHDHEPKVSDGDSNSMKIC